MTLRRLLWPLVTLLAAFAAAVPVRAGQLASVIQLPGSSTDLSTHGSGLGFNRLAIGSDLYYDAAANVYYGVADQPSGTLPYRARMQKFTLDVHPTTGAASNFQLQETIFFKTADGSQYFDGRSAVNLNGSGSVLGLSFDSEGMVVGPNGNFFVADEYGPSLYEFQPVVVGGTTEARFVRAFTIPDNLLPRDANGINHDVGFTTPATTQLTGRQEGRGFESLAISPSGDKLYSMLQTPLQEEGTGATNPGRRSRNIRMVEFDIASGTSTAQYVYQSELIADINARIPPAAAFGATQQGRNIVVSGLVAMGDNKFLVLERDNRGIGDENPANTHPVLSHVGAKRIYQIDISGATDVSAMSLAGFTDAVPGVTPVGKSLFLDVQAKLQQAGLIVPEKLEGLARGPSLGGSRFALVLINDHDFTSIGVTDPAGILPPIDLDIYTNGTTALYTPSDDPSKSYALAAFEDAVTNPNLGPLPDGFAKLNTFIYSFNVPEPSSLGLAAMGGVVGMFVVVRRRVRRG